MSSESIERFTWYTVDRIRSLNRFTPWTGEDRVMLVSEHRRIVLFYTIQPEIDRSNFIQSH